MITDGLKSIMIPNYNQDSLGVIHQINHKPFVYSNEYIQHYQVMRELTDQMAHLRLGYILGVLNYAPASILDVGFGNGAFLSAAMKICSDVSGYDVMENPCLPDGCTRATDLFDRSYDLITFFDSLEHCEDLSFVQDLDCNYIAISVPWCHYVNDGWFQTWKHRKPDEHLHHFNDQSLINFMKENGFQYIAHSNIEDAIRKPVDDLPNILTAIFEKI